MTTTMSRATGYSSQATVGRSPLISAMKISTTKAGAAETNVARVTVSGRITRGNVIERIILSLLSSDLLPEVRAVETGMKTNSPMVRKLTKFSIPPRVPISRPKIR